MKKTKKTPNNQPPMTLQEYLDNASPETFGNLKQGEVTVSEDEFEIIVDTMNNFPTSGFVTVPKINSLFRESIYYKKPGGILYTVKGGMPHAPSVFSIPA